MFLTTCFKLIIENNCVEVNIDRLFHTRRSLNLNSGSLSHWVIEPAETECDHYICNDDDGDNDDDDDE